MGNRFFYFRPGIEATMVARCQFGVDEAGRCGALFTYPIRGYPWRHNVTRSFQFELSESDRRLLFEEVGRLRTEHPEECLGDEQLWSDKSEKANSVSRDRETNTPCVTIGIFGEHGEKHAYFSMRENSPALLKSPLYDLLSRLLRPHETLEPVRPN